MDNLINCPGLQHVAEEIFSNLTFKSLEHCKKVNKSWELILKNPLFLKLLEKRKNSPWFWLRNCMQHEKFGNKTAWKKAIQLNVGTYLEKRLTQYLETLYEHLEICQDEKKWCCMNINNELFGTFWSISVWPGRFEGLKRHNRHSKIFKNCHILMKNLDFCFRV